MRNFMELVDDDDWDDEPHDRDDRGGDDGRLRHLVFLDGVLVDTFVRSARGSEYACVALEMEAQRRAREPEPPPVPSWERDLERLDVLVGGRAELLALTTEPLEATAVPAECAEVAGLLDALDLPELAIAVRNALARAHASCPALVAGAPAQVAAALAWIVAKANDLTGAKPLLRQTDLSRAFGLTTFPSTLASHLARELQRYLPEGPDRYWGGYGRKELGLPDSLVTAKRQQITRERDRALAAQERARRDAQARGA